MSENGWVASDSLVNSFDTQRPGGTSLLSVAIAVDNIDEFGEEYLDLMSSKVEKYDIRTPSPIIKNMDINRWVADWRQDEAHVEIAKSILKIDSVENIQITETYLEPDWFDIYQEDEYAHERISAQDLLSNKIASYYNIVSIWKYFNRDDNRPTDTQRNVLTDDFSGKYCKMWEDIGDESNHLNIVPNGDITYPLLSATDIVMGMLEQEVYPLFGSNMYEYLREFYKENDIEVWVDAQSVNPNKEYEFSRLIPSKDETMRREQHYPKPTIYINRSGGISRKELEASHLMRYACKYAHEKQGCVKSFHEPSDKYYLSDKDIIIDLENNGSLAQYEALYDDVNVIQGSKAIEELKS